jgi:hypothetical protein
MLRFLWIAGKGYRLDPWNSPYLRWRMETYWGLHADQISGPVFRAFVWQHRSELWRFLVWASRNASGTGVA